MNQRRLTVFLKMGFVKVVMWLSKNCAATDFKCRCKGIVGLSKNDDSRAFESILQIGRLAGRSGV